MRAKPEKSRRVFASSMHTGGAGVCGRGRPRSVSKRKQLRGRSLEHIDRQRNCVDLIVMPARWKSDYLVQKTVDPWPANEIELAFLGEIEPRQRTSKFVG